MCFVHSGVAEVLGALDVLLGVPGGAEHFEATHTFERVPAGVASRGPSNSLKDELQCELARVKLVGALLFALWVLKVCEGEE